MKPIKLRTKVGPDGVLSIVVPVGIGEANRDVTVVVETILSDDEQVTTLSSEGWKQFILQTAGAWQGDFERP